MRAGSRVGKVLTGPPPLEDDLDRVAFRVENREGDKDPPAVVLVLDKEALAQERHRRFVVVDRGGRRLERSTPQELVRRREAHADVPTEARSASVSQK